MKPSRPVDRHPVVPHPRTDAATLSHRCDMYLVCHYCMAQTNYAGWSASVSLARQRQGIFGKGKGKAYCT